MDKDLTELVDVEVDFMTDMKNHALSELDVTESEAWLFSIWVWQTRDWLKKYLTEFSKLSNTAGKDLRGEN